MRHIGGMDGSTAKGYVFLYMDNQLVTMYGISARRVSIAWGSATTAAVYIPIGEACRILPPIPAKKEF